jgi:hypothetical protein
MHLNLTTDMHMALANQQLPREQAQKHAEMQRTKLASGAATSMVGINTYAGDEKEERIPSSVWVAIKNNQGETRESIQTQCGKRFNEEATAFAQLEPIRFKSSAEWPKATSIAFSVEEEDQHALQQAQYADGGEQKTEELSVSQRMQCNDIIPLPSPPGPDLEEIQQIAFAAPVALEGIDSHLRALEASSDDDPLERSPGPASNPVAALFSDATAEVLLHLPTTSGLQIN